MKNKEFKAANKKVTNQIAEFLKPTYFPEIPVRGMMDILQANGFDTIDMEGVYCGTEGHVNIRCPFINDRLYATYMTFSWYRMPSGKKYEIVGYAS